MASNYSPRTMVWNNETLAKVNLDKALDIYRARFANPADSLFTLTGNINPEDKAFPKMVCTWLGGMTTPKQR